MSDVFSFSHSPYGSKNYKTHYLFVGINKLTMNLSSWAPMTSTWTPPFVLSFESGPDSLCPTNWMGELPGCGHSVRLTPTPAAWLALAQGCLAGPLCDLFSLLHHSLPFGLDDCIWLTYFLTMAFCSISQQGYC